MSEYAPIKDYGVIGNLRSAALIGKDGSIDWCCFPVIGSPSVFAALLDSKKGGRFKVSLPGNNRGDQRYSGDTNILVTEFRDGNRHVLVTDMMPIWGNISGCGKSSAPAEIHRIIECKGEDTTIAVEWSPRFDYAGTATRISRIGGGWLASGGGKKLVLGGAESGDVRLDQEGETLTALLSMERGNKTVLVTRWNSENTETPLKESLALLDSTARIWREWAHKEGSTHNEDWAGKWFPMVIRSELLFKLLSHSDTGAFVAAPTTSLPETIGGVRNWDYRYTWIRDASLTVQALTAIGHEREAVDLLHWMENVTSRSFEEGWEIQIMYDVHGESELEEKELHHLEGYKCSRPVRTGNGAAKQLQLETYGEILNTGYELARRGHRFRPKILRFLKRVTNHVYSVWQEPDHGIWEMRNGLRHFTYSKVMVWVTFDRAVYLAEKHGMQGDTAQWKRARDDVRAQILKHGFNKEAGAFTLAFDSRDLDAAVLRIPLLGFLPFEDLRIQSTINKVKENLIENGFVYRYRVDDGLPGKEGAFNLCTFWLVDALALSGRISEALEIFENILHRANHLGLFSEEIDPQTGEFLGNFPQAFTHIGLINSVIFLAHAQGKQVPGIEPIRPLSGEVFADIQSIS